MEQALERRKQDENQRFFATRRGFARRGFRAARDDVFWKREERKCFDEEHVTAGINFSKYDDIEVETVGGTGEEEPVESFQEAIERLKLPESLSATIERCGYSTPTPVQKYAIPAVVQGTDVMVTAQTGSGKTAAFLIPIITTALREGVQPPQEGPVYPVGIVLSPTRELCQQIAVEARRLTFKTGARVVTIYGGEKPYLQLKELAKGADIIVATPGRLEDFLQRGVIDVKNVKFLALDEADRMMDMGFEPQIREIVENHGMPEPGDRQTIMFSATFPEDMQNMALDYLDPAYMQIRVGEVGTVVSDIDQHFVDVGHEDKFKILESRLNEVRDEDGKPAKAVVFINTRNMVDNIAWRLRSETDFNPVHMHGMVDQMDRNAAIEQFKNGQADVLVATEVAARGLDIPGIGHVVNFDLPNSGEDYVHRIGRTARLGNKGVASTLVNNGGSPQDRAALPKIVSKLQDGDESVVLPDWLLEKAEGYY